MSKLHELLAAEKTPTGAWNTMLEETLKKFGAPSHYFEGHSKTLKMLEETPANENIEAQAREEKPVATTVYDTLEYALDIFGKAEDLQFQKNRTNAKASGTVMWRGLALLSDVPVDELLGLEARLTRIRQLFVAMPTLDATKHWALSPSLGAHLWETSYPEESVKTEKTMTPVIMAPATDKHPAQVQAVNKDIVVGKFTKISRSGAATTAQKADAIKRVDELLVEIKQARMRANETEVIPGNIADVLVPLLLDPLK